MRSTPARDGAELDAEITRFGETLAAYVFVPKPEHDEALLADYASALDAYDRAKSVLASAHTAAEASVAVRRVLAEGSQALARLDDRREGRPVRRSRPPCFFDERHGPSVTVVPWAPPGGVARQIPVCAADAVRLRDGDAPMTVEKPGQRQRPVQPLREKKRIARGGQGDQGTGGDRNKRAEPVGPGVVRLESPGPERFGIGRDPLAPAVLVLRAVSNGKRLSTTLQRLRPGAGSVRPDDLLLKAAGDFTARLPVPVTGGSEGTARFRISNSAVGGAPFDPLDFDVDRIPYWEAWLEPADGCREFTTLISGDGWDVVRYTGGRSTGSFTRDGRRGEVVVERLDPQFQPVEQLFLGHRSVVNGELALPAKRAWLAVHCQGAWSLAVNSDQGSGT